MDPISYQLYRACERRNHQLWGFRAPLEHPITGGRSRVADLHGSRAAFLVSDAWFRAAENGPRDRLVRRFQVFRIGSGGNGP